MELEIAKSERKVLEKISKLEYSLSRISNLAQDLKLELDKEMSGKDRVYQEHDNLYITLQNIEHELKDKKEELSESIDDYIDIEKNGGGTPK